MDKAMRYLFILSLVLIFVAYYAGLVTDIKAFAGAGDTLLKTATGRNAVGQFQAYPSGFTPIG